MRRGLVLVPVLCVALAACSSSSKGSGHGATTTEAPGVAETSTTPTIPKTGTEMVYVLSVDPGHSLTVDPIQFLTGQAATDEIKKFNASASHGPANDYVIVNPTLDHLVVPLKADAVIRVRRRGGTAHTSPRVISQSAFRTYSGLRVRPFSITVTNGSVTAVDEQFIP